MLSIVFAVLCILLAAYILYIQIQLRSLSRQLNKRLNEKTRQPLSIELINTELNNLTAVINKCLSEEEKLRLDSVKREKQIKELIANISHDLRTPLTSIRGYQQLIEKEPLSEEQRLKLKTVQKHTDELSKLIEHFFEYSLIVDAEPTLKFEKVNLTDVVIECLAESVYNFEEKGLTVNLEESPPIFIIADREMVIRVIQNLIRNCVQHSGGAVNVRLFITQYANLSFCNNVKNSSEIDAEKIFDRFYTTKARNSGSGLGLSIVKLLTDQMGGNVNAFIHNGIIEVCVGFALYNHKF